MSTSGSGPLPLVMLRITTAGWPTAGDGGSMASPTFTVPPCAVGVAVGVAVEVAVGVGVEVAVEVALGLGVAVGVGVEVDVAVGVAVAVSVTSGVGVTVGVTVRVGVTVCAATDKGNAIVKSAMRPTSTGNVARRTRIPYLSGHQALAYPLLPERNSASYRFVVMGGAPFLLAPPSNNPPASKGPAGQRVHVARLARALCVGGRRAHEAIADAPHVLDEVLLAARGLQLGPQPADEHLEILVRDAAIG